jgi:hypothetical protein
VLLVSCEHRAQPHFALRALVEASREGGGRLNRANQAYLLEFRQIALNVRNCLFHIHFVVRGNPIRQFFDDRVEGVNRIEIPHTPAKENNDRFTSNVARKQLPDSGYGKPVSYVTKRLNSQTREALREGMACF